MSAAVWFFRHHGGEISIVGPLGPKALSPDEATTWRNLGRLSYPQGMESMSDYAYSLVKSSLTPGVTLSGATASTISSALAGPLAAALAQPVARALAPLLSVLPDSDLERIRDAAVEALELSKGHIRGSVIHLQRGTTPPPPA